jgi:hypothetical protein
MGRMKKKLRTQRPRVLRIAKVGCLCGLVLVFADRVFAADVSIRFTNTTGAGTVGSNSIAAAPGDVLTARVSVEPDGAGISNYILSLEFDTGLGDALDLMSATELLDPAFELNLDAGCAATMESANGQKGRVLSCEAVTLGNGPIAPTSVDILEVVFQTTGQIASANAQMQTGFFNPGIDGMFDNGGTAVTPTHGIATVVPEPGVGAGLLAGILLGGGAARIRNRRRPHLSRSKERETSASWFGDLLVVRQGADSIHSRDAAVCVLPDQLLP